ncbi:MAG: hypothetical protein D6788_03125 [Planctomycetota bacterium]|nr:MAG: hypothetical protein D6788_03125 [Planctomycetota bacterium]
MYALLFERIVLLVIVLASFAFASLVLWARARTPLRSRVLAASLIALVSLPVVSLMVVTPRERIIRLCHRLGRYVDDGQVERIAAALSEDFHTDNNEDKTTFLERLRRTLTDYAVDQPHLRRFDVTFDSPDEAAAAFDAYCSVRGENVYRDRLYTRWRLTFRRVSDRWLVTSVEPLPAPLSPLRGLGDLLP